MISVFALVKAKGKVEVEVEGNQGTCFSDDNVNDNQGTCLASHEQSSLVNHKLRLFADGNDNDNQGTCFADDKQESSLSEEDDLVGSKARDSPTKQRGMPCSQCGCGCGCGGTPFLKVSRLGTPVNSKGNYLNHVNGSLQSWITDSNITFYSPSQKTTDV